LEHLHEIFLHVRGWVPEGKTSDFFYYYSQWQCFWTKRNIRLICVGKVPNRICSANRATVWQCRWIANTTIMDFDRIVFCITLSSPTISFFLSDALFFGLMGLFHLKINYYKKRGSKFWNKEFHSKKESVRNVNNVTLISPKIPDKLHFVKTEDVEYFLKKDCSLFSYWLFNNNYSVTSISVRF